MRPRLESSGEIQGVRVFGVHGRSEGPRPRGAFPF